MGAAKKKKKKKKLKRSQETVSASEEVVRTLNIVYGDLVCSSQDGSSKFESDLSHN